MSDAPVPESPGLILLTGATGYVGGRLLEALEDDGVPLRCLARRPERLSSRVAESTTVVKGSTETASCRPWLALPRPTTWSTR